MRQIWVAEATESSTYTLSHEIPRKSHLKEAAASAERWASRSCRVSFYFIQKPQLGAAFSDVPNVTHCFPAM